MQVFTASEQTDPAVSAENASPAGDGIANVLKYALGLDPHVSGAAGLPTTFTYLDPNTGERFQRLNYLAPQDVRTDLHYVVEVSPDLINWHRGRNAVVEVTPDYGPNPGDPVRHNFQAVSSVSSNAKLFMRLLVLKGNMLPEYWQRQHFGFTGVDPLADADGDRISNFDEYLADTDPNDVYSPDPVLTILGGNNQGGAVNQFVPDPLVVRVTNIRGLALLNAPVRFAVTSGGGQLSGATAGQPLAAIFDTRTNASGQAQTCYRQGSTAPVTSTIAAQAINQGRVSAQGIFRASTANPPTITLIAPQAGSTSSTSQVTVSVQVASDAPLDEVRINSILVAPADDAGHYVQTLTFSEGAHTISVRAKNIYGLVTIQQYPIYISALPPDVAILSPADGQIIAEGNVLVRVHADSSAATVSVNGRAATRRGFTFSVWVPLTPGANTLTAALTDPSGRTNSDSVTVQFSPPAGYDPNADSDGDGVPNGQDLFPYDKNNSTDRDNDGAGDNDDPNPDDPNVDGPVTIISPEDGLVIQAE